MVNKQLFFTPKLAPTNSFPYNTAEVRHINPKLPGNNAKVSFLESCNVNDSAKVGQLTTARELSSLTRPSVLGRVFKSGAIVIEQDEINS